MLAIGAGACSSANLPQLPASPDALETGAVGSGHPEGAPVETAVVVPGTPTEIYTLVAGGALRCWFGADGPLKATHVFHAEAAPPAEEFAAPQDEAEMEATGTEDAWDAAKQSGPDEVLRDIYARETSAHVATVRAYLQREAALPREKSADIRLDRGG